MEDSTHSARGELRRSVGSGMLVSGPPTQGEHCWARPKKQSTREARWPNYLEALLKDLKEAEDLTLRSERGTQLSQKERSITQEQGSQLSEERRTTCSA